MVLLVCVSFAFAAVDYTQIEEDTMFQNNVEYFQNPGAVSTTNILAARYPSRNVVTYIEDGDALNSDVSITQPFMPVTLRLRLISPAYDVTDGALRGTVFVNGIDARNNKIVERITVISGNATSSVGKLYRTTQAFARIDSVGNDSTFAASVSANDTISIGFDNKIGLAGPIMQWRNVYKIIEVSQNLSTNHIDFAHIDVTSANVNPSGNYYLGKLVSVFKPKQLADGTTTPSYQVYYRQWQPAKKQGN